MSNLNKDIKEKISDIRNISPKKPVKVIAITSAKGGVGKTNISVNLAVGLAQKGNKVLLLDADLGLANIDIMLGLHAKYNLSHVMEGKCHLSEIIIEGPLGIQVVPAAPGIEYMTQLSPMEHAGIIDAFNEITNELDYMIIDTAAGISDTVLSFTRSANELVVVVCDEPTSIMNAYALIKIMNKRYERQNIHILANLVRNEREGQILFDKLIRVSEQFLDVSLEYHGAIPFDKHVHDSVKMQQSILLAFPNTAASNALRKFCDDVCSWSFAETLVGSTSFFIERFISEG